MRESERKRLVELLDNSFKEELGMNLNKPFLDGFAERILADGWMRPPVKVGQKLYLISDGLYWEDELRWLYPNMTDEEIADKLARISAQAQTNTDQALERILAGQ